MKLDTKPRADVTVDVSSTAGATVAPATLTFTESNYSTAQTVTVTGAHDADADNTMATVTLEFASDDERFDDLADETVAVTVTDDDTELAQVQGLSLAATSGQIVASWSTVPNASGYRIEWSCTDPATTTGDHDVTGQTTATYTIPNLPNDSPCSVTVRALGAGAASGTGTADGPRSGTQTATPMMAVDNPPTVTTTMLTIAENEMVVPDKVQANDADVGDTVTGFALAGNGADNSKFTIDNQGTLRFKNPPDFEANGSAAGNNDYKITVTATSGSGTPLISPPTPITVTVTNVNEPPGAPADPTITEQTDNSFKVSWQTPATNTGPAVNRYDVEYKEDTATGWQQAQNEPTSGTLEVTISGLMPATNYDVRVRAANPEGDGAWSSDGGVRASTLTPQLDTPGNLVLTAGDGEIEVSWNDVNNEVGYSIDWTCDGTHGSDTVGADVTSYDIDPSPPLANGTECTVTVTATAGLNHRDSAAVSGTATPVADPNVRATGAPTITHGTPPLVGDTLTAQTTDIADDDGLTGATYSYQWIRGTNTNIGTNQSTYTLTEADRGSTIKVQVSFTDDRNFPESRTSAATPAVKQKLAVPQNFAVATNGDAQVSFTWTAVNHATGYTVTRLTPGPADTQTASGTAHTWTGLTNGETYTFAIRATAGTDFVASDNSSSVIGQPNFAGAASAALSSNRDPLTEANIGGSTLTVDLTNATFSNPLSKDGFQIVSIASGLSVNTVTRAGNTRATVTVAASGFNIAEDIPIQVRIPAAAVDHIGSGGLDSGSVTVKTVNTAPTFTIAGATRTFNRPENQTAVGSVPATDSDPEDDVTYALSGTDAALFSIDANGAITFNEAPNFEDPRGAVYSFTVTATGGADARAMTAMQDITVNVTDVTDERPGQPDEPTIGTVTVNSIAVSWSPPTNEGPAITDYDLRWREQGTTAWTVLPDTGANAADTATNATISSGLTHGKTYEVQVRAQNADGTGPWSDSATATTAANAAPTFTGGMARTFTANENQTIAGTVQASDADDGDDIESYAIPTGAAGGADRDKFNIDSGTGTLTFKTAPNFEAAVKSADGDNDYEVVVRATSGTGARELTADQTVTVRVADDGTDEFPGKPAAPGFTTAGITPLTLPVTWVAPATNPGPVITSYNLQYRVKTPQGAWIPLTGRTGTSADITGLAPGTAYQVQVRAVNADGAGDWSDSAEATTATNASPAFAANTDSFSVDENTPATTPVGTVTATDGDGADNIESYDLSGTDADEFEITDTGVLTFKADPDFERSTGGTSGNSHIYKVTVTVTSGTGDREATAMQEVTVTVSDLTEPPVTPDPPTFGTTTVNSIVVNWEEPANDGPAPVTYDLRYREKSPGNLWIDVNSLTGTTYTIRNLTVNTLYEVEVRAKNAEGESAYAGGEKRTSANEEPRFTSSATFAVNENETTQTVDGMTMTVVAVDDDDEDSVTGYTLGGDDAEHFTLGATSGVLAFSPAPDFENGSGGGDGGTLNVYTITVTAESGTGDRALSAPQTITITVSDLEEAPDKPAPPTLEVVDFESLRARWTAPDNRGPSPVLYRLQYRLTDASGWTDGPTGVSALTDIIGGLDHGELYVARVQAENEEGASEWSEASTTAVATHGNNPPGFASTVLNYDVQENTTAVTTVTATDPDAGDVPADATITYTLEGDDGGKFRIGSGGALTFESGKNFEDPDDANTNGVYEVTVRATSGTGAREMSATRSFTVTLTDAGGEAPGQPAAPTVDTPTVNSLNVSWSAPATNTGPAIIDYDVRWQKTAPDPNIPGDGDWIELPDTGDDAQNTDTSVTISGLDTDSTGVEYRVQVRAQNVEGAGNWSPSTSRRTAANGPPDFTDATIAFTVDENTDVATQVGTVTATDPDGGDTVTGYTLGGVDASKFDISSTGVLTFDSTQVPTIDFEMPQDVGGRNIYNITVTATSGTGDRVLMADQAVTVTVRNVDETPSGKPSIDDTTPQVGQELTAGPGDIATPDTPSPVFSYQWNRIDGGTSRTITGATGANYTVQEADGGLTLTVTARWTDGFDGSTQELTSDPTGVVATVPGAPTGVMADSFTSSGFVIRWTAPATGGRTITAYEYRFRETGGWQSTGNDNTSRNFTSLTLLHADRDTLFEVRAVNAVGEGPPATIVLNRQMQVNTPTVSLSLDTNSIDESGSNNSAVLTVTLDGTATTADTVFSVPQHDDYGSSPASRTIAAGSGARSVTFTITAADDNTYEPNRVVDVDVAITYTGTPAIPDPAPARLTIEEDDLQPPARVTGVTVVPVAEGLTVTWNEADRADGYKVHWRSGGTYPQANERTRVGSSSTTETIPNLDPDTTYTVRVIATRTGADDGPESDDSLPGASGRPKAQPPGLPANVMLTPGGESLTVSWTAGSNAEGHKVQWKLDTVATWAGASEQDGIADVLFWTIPGLTPGVDYDVRVAATRSNADDSGWTPTETAAPLLAALAQVTNVQVRSGVRELTVTWSPVPNAEGYKVQWKSGTQGFEDARQLEVTGTRATIPALEPLESYTVRVIATRAGGADGTPSTDATGTPARSDRPGLAVGTPAPSPVREGAAASFTVELDFQPTADVVVALLSGDTDTVTLQPAELTFTPDNWAMKQTVTARAIEDDDAADETVRLTVRVVDGRSAPAYRSVGDERRDLSVTDNDTASVTVATANLFNVPEDGSATYTVVLDRPPSASVQIRVASDDTTALRVTPATLVFSRSNWNTPKQVTARGVRDPDSDHESVTISHEVIDASSADEYDGISIASVTATLADIDNPGVRVSQTTLNPAEGGTARYTLRLNTQPSEDVTVAVSSNNSDVTVDADDQASGDQATVTFTSSNWSSTRTVTVRAAQDDDAAEDEATLTHAATSGDSDYGGIEIPTVAVTVDDDETQGITLGALSVSPVEENGTATYTVVLDAQPTSSVVIDVASDNRDVTTQPARLTFTTGNWDEAQTVTVNAADDGDSIDETATLTHTVADAQSADEYDGLSSTLEVRVLDDDVPGLALSVPALTVVEEATATYTVALQVRPSADVVVAVAGDNPDVSVDMPRLTFTADDWDTAQTVTVSAARDGDVDDDAAVLAHHIVDDRSAAEFQPVPDETLAVTVDDNDTEVSRSITLLPAAVDEGDGTVEIQVAVDLGEVLRDRFYILQAAPARRGEDFTDGERVDGDLPEQAVFTLPWRITLIDDNAQEDEEAVAVTFEVVNPGGDVVEFLLQTTLTIVDNDGPGVRASSAALTVAEDGSQQYTLQLNTQPLAAVTVAVESDNVEVTASPASLTFTANDWNTPKTVTVAALSDGDGVEDRAVLTHTATSSDSNYNGVTIGDVAVTVPAGPKRPDPGTGSGTGSTGGGGGGGGGGTPNRAPETGETLAAATVAVGASLAIDLSEAFADADDDDLTYGAESSDESVATVSVDGAALTLRGVALGTARITVTATDPDDASVSQTFTVTVTEPATADDLGAAVWLFASASDPMRQGFARVLNHSDASGTATVTATDDAGRTYEPLRLTLGPRQAAPFNSDDLESGNAAKGLAGGTGPGTGGWRFEVASATLDVEALGYLRTADGFVTAMVATVPADEAGTRRVATFNPASNFNQVSHLRLVNPHDEDAEATVAGVDDAGRSPGSAVELTVPARTACTVDAAELETGRGLDCGSLQVGIGDGAGKWRLAVESDPPLVAMSLLSSPTGHLTNLSGVASADANGVWHAHLFPSASDPLGRQGFVRVRNLSDEVGTVTIAARDDTDNDYGTLTLALGAGQTRHFNSDDLEVGNAAKGLTGSTGSGAGTWRLALSSDDIDIEAHAYIRTTEGFLTAVNAAAPAADRVHRIAFFNPGSNTNQVSVLRLVNPGTRTAVATVAGTDDAGASPGTTVRVLVPAGDAVDLTAAELESGNASAITAGALGDGRGKWRLRVEADRDIVAMSLLSSPTGHLTNLSRADPTRND